MVNFKNYLKAENLNQENQKRKQQESNIVVPLPDDAFVEDIKKENNLKKNKKSQEIKKNKNFYPKNYFKIKQGETQLVIISNLGLNHIKTNIKNPYVYTASSAKIKVSNYNIFINAVGIETPIDLFIEAPNGNVYSLTLIPKQVPPQTLFFTAIDYQENPVKESQKKLTENESIYHSLKSYTYIQYIKNIIKQMALGKEIQGFIQENVNKENSIEFNDLKSVLIKRYISSSLIGEIWKIKNIGVSLIKLSPKDFYSRDVLAVGLELSKNLRYRVLLPNQSCFLYIVKKITKNED